MPDRGISEQIGEIGGVIRTMLGLTRHSRIRDQLRETIELYQQIEGYRELDSSRSDLANVIAQQTARLVEASSSTRRDWNWGALLVAWVIAGGFAVAGFYLAPHWGSWWGTLLLVIAGTAGSLFLIAGLGVLLERKSSTV